MYHYIQNKLILEVFTTETETSRVCIKEQLISFAPGMDFHHKNIVQSFKNLSKVLLNKTLE